MSIQQKQRINEIKNSGGNTPQTYDESTLDFASSVIEAWEARLPVVGNVPDWINQIRQNVATAYNVRRFPGEKYAPLIGDRAICGPSRYNILRARCKKGDVTAASEAWQIVCAKLVEQRKKREEKRRRAKEYEDHIYMSGEAYQ